LFVSNNQVSTISIPTNGLEPEIICSTAGSILAAHPELALNIMLSLDGFQETHDFIRKEGSFTKVLESARKLKELSKCFPRLSLSFSCTINNHNWQELPELAKFIRDTFQAKLDFTILSGHPRDSAFVAPLREELAETLDGLLSISQNSPLQRLRNKIYRDTLLKANFESRQVVPCRAGSLVGLIYANGDVHACPRLATLGNIRSKNFRDIWHGQQALEQFRTISLGTCNCNDDCFIRVSLTNYWKLPFFMLRNLVGL
jgi:MoaA/NifB/PqqE/SkfB family radical SAM enzyme